MKERYNTIILDPDPGGAGYTVIVPTMPGIITQGATIDEAIAKAKEAIQFHIEGLLADGPPSPRRPSRHTA